MALDVLYLTDQVIFEKSFLDRDEIGYGYEWMAPLASFHQVTSGHSFTHLNKLFGISFKDLHQKPLVSYSAHRLEQKYSPSFKECNPTLQPGFRHYACEALPYRKDAYAGIGQQQEAGQGRIRNATTLSLSQEK